MQAAVDMGVSELQAGKIFQVPSVTRVLKELRDLKQSEALKTHQLDPQSRQDVLVQYQRLKA